MRIDCMHISTVAWIVSLLARFTQIQGQKEWWRREACSLYTTCTLRVKDAQEDCGGGATHIPNEGNCAIVNELRQELLIKQIQFFSLLGECTTNGTLYGHLITKTAITKTKDSKSHAEHCPDTVERFEEMEQNRSSLSDDNKGIKDADIDASNDPNKIHIAIKSPRRKRRVRPENRKDREEMKRAKKKCRNRVKKLRRTCGQLKQCCSTAKECIAKLQKMQLQVVIQQVREDLKAALKMCKK